MSRRCPLPRRLRADENDEAVALQDTDLLRARGVRLEDRELRAVIGKAGGTSRAPMRRISHIAPPTTA